VNVAADEPAHEEGEHGAQDDPFDHHSFLDAGQSLILQCESCEHAAGRAYISVPEPVIAITPHRTILILDAVSLIEDHFAVWISKSSSNANDKQCSHKEGESSRSISCKPSQGERTKT
jgi:hypothetical protein